MRYEPKHPRSGSEHRAFLTDPEHKFSKYHCLGFGPRKYQIPPILSIIKDCQRNMWVKTGLISTVEMRFRGMTGQMNDAVEAKKKGQVGRPPVTDNHPGEPT
jgi:hypothetical protein